MVHAASQKREFRWTANTKGRRPHLPSEGMSSLSRTPVPTSTATI